MPSYFRSDSTTARFKRHTFALGRSVLLRTGIIKSGTRKGNGPAFGGKDFRDMGTVNTEDDEYSAVDGPCFTGCMAFIVLCNLVSVGLETDIQDDSWSILFAYFNGIFLLLYISEIVMRLLIQGPDTALVFDGVLVITAFVERNFWNSGFGRALPAFRLWRALRLLRDAKSMRNQRELLVLVSGARRSAVSLAWVSIGLSLVLWACAAFAKHAIGNSAAWVGTMDPSVPHEPFEPLRNVEYFGSVSRSFVTLLQVVTLSGWGDIGRRVVRVYPGLFIFFGAFICFTSFGITKSVISNIVQDCLVAAKDAEKASLELSQENRRQLGNQAMDVLRLADRDGDGELMPKEIDRALEMTNLQELLNELKVPKLDGTAFVRLFDRDGSGTVSMEEMIDGLVALDEEIKPKDYVKLAMWAENLLMRTKNLAGNVEVLSGRVAELRLTLEKAFEAMDYFKHNKDVTGLRHHAITQIRDAPASEIPKLREWKPPEVPKFPPEDQALVLRQFMRRWVVSGTQADQSHMTHWTRKGELPPAPPRLNVQAEMYRVQNESVTDKYWVEPDPERDGIPGPSHSLKVVKELLM